MPVISDILRMSLSLFVVLLALLAFTWLLRRLNQGRFSGGSPLKVISGVMVGPKERVMIVELQTQWLVLGVTQQHISLLHTLPKPEPSEWPTQPCASSPFAQRLFQAIRQRKSSGKG